MDSTELRGMLVPQGGLSVLEASLVGRSVASMPIENSIDNVSSNDPVARVVVEIGGKGFPCPDSASQIPCGECLVGAEAVTGEDSGNARYTNKFKDLRFVSRGNSSALVGSESIYFGTVMIQSYDVTLTNADTISVAKNSTPTGDPAEDGAANSPVEKGESPGRFREEDNLIARTVCHQAVWARVLGFNLLANNISLLARSSRSLLVSRRR
jgi:hypothetical protein